MGVDADSILWEHLEGWLVERGREGEQQHQQQRSLRSGETAVVIGSFDGPELGTGFGQGARERCSREKGFDIQARAREDARVAKEAAVTYPSGCISLLPCCIYLSAGDFEGEQHRSDNFACQKAWMPQLVFVGRAGAGRREVLDGGAARFASDCLPLRKRFSVCLLYEHLWSYAFRLLGCPVLWLY